VSSVARATIRAPHIGMFTPDYRLYGHFTKSMVPDRKKIRD
jgi:hypothetical protein